MLRVALRPKFLGLLALMVVATIVCGLLAGWQWDRAHRAITDKAAGSEQLGDIRGVVGVGDAVTNEIAGDTVTAEGRYVPGEQVLVPGRAIQGHEDEEAVIIVTSFLVTFEDGTEARLPVARGWVPASDLTGEDGTLDPALAPAAPEGTQTISGRLEASEAATGGVSDGIAGEIATPLLVNEWGAPMYSGYLALDSAEAPLQVLPAAESEFSRGLDWQNIGYSFQWVLFGVFFLYLWWRSVRASHLDEVAERREALERAFAESTAAESTAAESTAAENPSAVPASTLPTTDKDV
ncbi:SURF1 family protein [Brachybacterium aquaticum]|uniref:SURF1-like protein n=1 Tax=Brachybacterium aquaticum TaxID=1432564 RepID=A0A841AE49_9MICO|nr:SURF1 family protein [Brachybacterium aquaticum]MBB5832207.1 DNA-binding transcriptional regulator of glucitol operon [Brachybacterium aquaticum]